MSINVTVSGNPVSIKRGKMVTADLDYSKKEFEKRRLMRLEQVRQQSKDIAEDVRNKVRKEKKKQMSEIEREGKEKLKNWQNRKLLELQTQYQDALKEIGIGHQDAEELEIEDEIFDEQQEVNNQSAKRRGHAAATKLRVDKNKEEYIKAVPIQQKKIVRDIENTRAALVTNMKKYKCSGERNTLTHKKRKMPSADINITLPDSADSDSNSEDGESTSNVSGLPSIPEEDSEAVSSCQYPENRNKPEIPTGNSNISFERQMEIPKLNMNSQILQGERNIKIAQDTNILTDFNSCNIQVPLDTRISDRIKRREIIAAQPDYCDLVAPVNPIPLVEGSSKIWDTIESRCAYRPYFNDTPSNTNIPPNRNNVYIHDKNGNSDKPITEESKRLVHVPQKERQRENEIHGARTESDTGKSKIQSMEPQPPNEVFNIGSMDRGYSGSGPIHDIPDKYKSYATIDTGAFLQPNSRVNDKEHQEVPLKPPVRLRHSKEAEEYIRKSTGATFSTLGSRKVRYYDHPNRFQSEREFPSTSTVKKISNESIEVIPNMVSEAEFYEKMRQRDKEAQSRGKKALEKEKIRRDYEDMMKKLPLLQKKETIGEISKDKPEYHMSEERLKELERKRQNTLENVYSEAFPSLRPAVVTLPSKHHNNQAGKGTFKTIEPEKSSPYLNLGRWDVDYDSPKKFSVEEVQEIVKAFTGQRPQDRQSKLKELLKSLKLQKEQLIKEIKSLPKDESIDALVNDLISVSDNVERSKESRKSEKSKRKRRHEENENVSSTDSSISEINYEKKNEAKVRSTRHGHEKTPPRKKVKMKSRKILILQNISTQTTPKPVQEKEVNVDFEKDNNMAKLIGDSANVICEKLHVVCDCNKENQKLSSEEICQIVIKLNDEEKPKVVVESGEKLAKTQMQEEPSGEKNKITIPTKKISEKKVRTKSVATETDALKKPKGPKTDISKKNEKVKPLPAKSQFGGTSWREHLSKNSISTTSTSYLSPPDFSTTKESTVASSSLDKSRPTRSLIGEGNIDPRLLSYIKKLLNMSRPSIDDLAVSTSDVQTPSQSIIEIESNNPLAQLHNIIRYFNLNAEELVKELSYSPDSTEKHYNTTASTEASLRKSTDQNGRYETMVPEKDSADSVNSKKSVLCQYADVTDSCSKRIENLTAMIQKLREEKLKMIHDPINDQLEKSKSVSPVVSEKDHSTAYMDLPPSGEKSKESSKYSSLTSLEEEELNKKILEIDMSLARKLRRFSPIMDEEKVEVTNGDDNKVENHENNVNEDFLVRLQRLTEKSHPSSNLPSVIECVENDGTSFVPVLSDIKMLPRLEAQPLNYVESNHRRPPPSKGLSSVKRFNGNISQIPHELSTIIEADSQMSTKIATPRINPDSSDSLKLDVSQNSAEESKILLTKYESEQGKSSNEQIYSDKRVPSPVVSVTLKKICDDDKCLRAKEVREKLPTPVDSSANSSKSKSCDDSSCSRTRPLSASKKSSNFSSSSSEDLETVEAMLRSIGMEWAIPTLYKTQEALALTSSSSSIDLNMKKSGKKSSGSEVSLKDFLQKQLLLSKISSSTFRSDASPGSLFEFSDLSAIQENASLEKRNQRTSTPIISSKGTNRSKDSDKRTMFTAESELSSVKDTSEKQSYYTLDEQSSESRSNS